MGEFRGRLASALYNKVQTPEVTFSGIAYRVGVKGLRESRALSETSNIGQTFCKSEVSQLWNVNVVFGWVPHFYDSK